MPIEYILLGASILLLLSVLGSLASARIGVPALILFLIIGMMAGSDGPGGIQFDYPAVAQSLGVVALSFILFAGGYDTDWQRTRPIVWKALPLSTVGVLITAFLVGWFANVFLGFTWLEGMLLGSIVSSTDAAAVFAVLRSRGIRLRGHLKELLELESGSNDPMGVVLTLAIIQLLTNPGTSFGELLGFFVVQMTVGAVLGVAMGELIRWTLNTLKLELTGIYPVLSVAFALLTYGLAAELKGSGFLAVYLAGLFLRRRPVAHKRSLVQFHDGLAWLMQIAMFLILGLQVFPARLLPIAGIGLLMSLFLIFAARPLSVYAALAFSHLSFREQTLIAWVGLRGAVPIVLATFPVLAGIQQADTIFHLVFFIAVTSVLLQGPPIPWITRLLGVDRSPPGSGG